MLILRGIEKRFGALAALSDIDLEVEAGEVLGIIGPNGSGKTTLLNAVTGVHAPSAGRITFQGTDITGWKGHRIARLGVARTFQNVRLFPTMTVFQNVWAAQHRRGDVAWRELLFAGGSAERRRRGEVDYLLERTGLADRRDLLAGGLPLPDQRRLELARALARAPRLLLLDEPAGGMTPAETGQMIGLIREVAMPGRTCIVIEHKMEMIRELCDRVCVLNFGRKVAEGSPAAVLRDDAVIEAYIGREVPADA